MIRFITETINYLKYHAQKYGNHKKDRIKFPQDFQSTEQEFSKNFTLRFILLILFDLNVTKGEKCVVSRYERHLVVPGMVGLSRHCCVLPGIIPTGSQDNCIGPVQVRNK